MNIVKLSSAHVHYREQGRGTPIVLLHANPGDSRDFDAVVPSLAQYGRVIALDWPGFGASPAPMRPDLLPPDFHPKLLAEFLQALQLEPAVLIGNSLGGNAAVRAAVASPHLVKALVLVSPGGFTKHSLRTRIFTHLQGSRWALEPHRWASRYVRVRGVWTRGLLQRAHCEQAQPLSVAMNRATWRMFLDDGHDLREKVSALKVPTLLIFGRLDPAVPASRDGVTASRCLPHARYVALKCGHVAFAEVPELFLQEVIPFLEQQSALQTRLAGETP